MEKSRPYGRDTTEEDSRFPPKIKQEMGLGGRFRATRSHEGRKGRGNAKGTPSGPRTVTFRATRNHPTAYLAGEIALARSLIRAISGGAWALPADKMRQ